MQVILLWMRTHVPQPARLLVSGSSADAYGAATQTAFYAQIGTGQACNAWTNRMGSELSRRQASPNFRSCLAAGDTHNIPRAPLFYGEQSSGMPFAVWLGALMENDQPPTNQRCPTCGTPKQGCSP
jgi:hypothetical protein